MEVLGVKGGGMQIWGGHAVQPQTDGYDIEYI